MTQLRVGTFSPPVVLDVAASTGELEAVGLTVTEHPVASSPAQFRSLLDGELHVALTSPDNVLAYRFSPHNPLQRVLDARIVGAVDRALGLGLYGRPDFGADDLRGARVGVDVPTSGFAMALYSLAASLGVDRDEYELVALGSTPKRLQALLRGECDATMLNAGNELVAEEAGCVRLAGVAERLSPYLGTVVAVVGDQYLGRPVACCGRSRPREGPSSPAASTLRSLRRPGVASGSASRWPGATGTGSAAPLTASCQAGASTASRSRPWSACAPPGCPARPATATRWRHWSRRITRSWAPGWLTPGRC